MVKTITTLLLFLSVLQMQAQTGMALYNRVCAHYSIPKDSLKLKSARFLFNNIKYHGTIKSELQDVFYQRLAQIEKGSKYPECKNLIFALADSVKHLPHNYKNVCDIDEVAEQYIINNIDEAYDKWENGNFAQHLSFDEFCEYLLPYRIANENIGKEWRREMFERYKRGLESISKIDDKKYSAYWGATQVNDLIRKERMNIQAIPHFGGVDFPVDVLKNLRMGECRDYAFKTAYAMRACGIPVCVDFTPQWPSRPHGHHWNVVLDNNGKNIPFMGAESNPGYPCKDDYPKAKVFRYTFGYQTESLFNLNLKYNEDIPPVFNTPFIKDVTEEYSKCVNICVEVKNNTANKHFAYLAVFNNQKWIPIAFAPIVNGKAIFKRMGRNAVYLPSTWEGACKPISVPILVKSNGDIVSLKPSAKGTASLEIKRKYPIYSVVHNYSKRMVLAKFEMADNPNFDKTVEVGCIKRNPEMGYDSILIDLKEQKYRYLRYVSPKKSYCNVAEIMFFNNGKRIYPVNYAGNKKPASGSNAAMAFDDNLLSFYQTQDANNAMLAVDFGKPIRIDKIKYMPRNDDNFITKGHQYTLCYYGGKGEVVHCMQTAENETLHFNDLPNNALFILHDQTKGKEERPFTINNGNIIWH